MYTKVYITLDVEGQSILFLPLSSENILSSHFPAHKKSGQMQNKTFICIFLFWCKYIAVVIVVKPKGRKCKTYFSFSEGLNIAKLVVVKCHKLSCAILPSQSFDHIGQSVFHVVWTEKIYIGCQVHLWQVVPPNPTRYIFGKFDSFCSRLKNLLSMFEQIGLFTGCSFEKQ